MIERFFSPPQFENDLEKTREASITHYITLILLTTSVIGLIISNRLSEATASILLNAVVLLAFFVWLTSLLAIKRGYHRVINIIIIVFNGLVLNSFSILNYGTSRSGFFVGLMLMGLATLLLSARGIIITAIINSLASTAIYIAGVQGLIPQSSAPSSPINNLVVYIFITVALGVFLAIAANQLRNSTDRARKSEKDVAERNKELQTFNQGLEKIVKERTAALEKRAAQFEAITYTARASATAQSLNELLSTITQDISIRFNYYHVGIFLLDTNQEFAILSSANSQGGQNMLLRNHRLKVGEQGIVGYVTHNGNPRIALDVGDDAVFFNNPDLPETHSEVALPLKFGNEIIGALDIQSKEINAFSQEDVKIFSILADQVSVAIQNTKSIEQAQQALREAEIASGQLTTQAWKDYAEKFRTRGYRYDGVKSDVLTEPSNSQDQKSAFSIPVQLRGQTIGHIRLKASDASRKWTEDELAIIESTGERAALAMEGARLLEEAQKRAVRETFLSEIGTKLGTSFQLDSILRDTVEELGQNLKGSTVSFQLVNPSAPPTADTPKTDGASARKKKSE